MMDDTNAANSGLAQPLSFDSSTCTKSRPKNGWLVFSMRPYMCTPQPLQAWRWMVALASTDVQLLLVRRDAEIVRG